MNKHLVSTSGKLVPQHQYSEMPKLRHENVIIPSTSAPAWGGYFVFDIKDKNIRIHDLILQFNVSALTGYTVATGSPTYLQRYTPAVFWYTRIEIVQNGNVIQTIYPGEQFLNQQLFNFDEKRALINAGEGSYSSISQRVTMAGTASPYYVNLSTYFSQTHQPLYDNKDDVQIRIYMDTLANNAVAPSGGTFTLSSSTPVSTINSANLIVKLTRESSELASLTKNYIKMKPHHFGFTELRYGSMNVNAGAVSANLVLTTITGPVSYLFFTVRPLTGLTGENMWNYTAISNYAILDASSTNIVGGQNIPSALSLLILNDEWSRSSYTNETSVGTGTNNNANVYLYSFGADPLSTYDTATFLNHHKFTGNEQLQINFTSALGAAVQVDVYAYIESFVEVSERSVKKLQ